MTTLTVDDRGHLMHALVLASHPPLRTSPNPSVGCVLARGSTRLAEGVTAPAGGAHAEVLALRAAGGATRGATAYVTLEPCAHEGRTPPCVGALVGSGVRRVVIAHPEINRAATGGADALRGAGIEVDGPLPMGDLLRDAVAGQLEGFRRLVLDRRPHVTLKLAQTADGALRHPDGERWITSPSARRAVHRWRCRVDAVLVGTGTVLADDPRLDARDVDCAASPRPVVLDTRLSTPPAARVVRRGALIVTAEATLVTSPQTRDELETAGATVVAVPSGTTGGIALEPALRALADRGIASVLAETGATLSHALLEADLVDRIVLHVAPGVGDGPPAHAVPLPDGWRIERVGGAGPDLVLHLTRGRELGEPELPGDDVHDAEAA